MNQQIFEKLNQIPVNDIVSLRDLRTYLSIRRIAITESIADSMPELSVQYRKLFILQSMIIALDMLIITVENNLF